MEDKTYNVYRGLQRPLIFKGFKGKYIYLAGATVIGSFLACAIVTNVLSFWAGAITLVIGGVGGLFLLAKLQKRGLYIKNNKERIYVFKNLFITYGK